MKLRKRLDDLERKTVSRRRPGYAVFATEAEYQAAVDAGLGEPVKVYIGVSPDDWPENEPMEVTAR